MEVALASRALLRRRFLADFLGGTKAILFELKERTLERTEESTAMEWLKKRMVEGSIDTGQSSLRAAFGVSSCNLQHIPAAQFAASSQVQPSMEQQFYASPSVGIAPRITESEQKIIAQAEFYLSEDYLTKNAYLLRQVFYRKGINVFNCKITACLCKTLKSQLKNYHQFLRIKYFFEHESS